MNFVTLHNQGPVSIVTLNRPERLNAMSGALMTDLHQALVAAHADPDTRAIVFTGAATRSSENVSENRSCITVLTVPSAGSVHAVITGAILSSARISSPYTAISPMLPAAPLTLA